VCADGTHDITIAHDYGARHIARAVSTLPPEGFLFKAFWTSSCSQDALVAELNEGDLPRRKLLLALENERAADAPRISSKAYAGCAEEEAASR